MSGLRACKFLAAVPNEPAEAVSSRRCMPRPSIGAQEATFPAFIFSVRLFLSWLVMLLQEM